MLIHGKTFSLEARGDVEMVATWSGAHIAIVTGSDTLCIARERLQVDPDIPEPKRFAADPVSTQWTDIRDHEVAWKERCRVAIRRKIYDAK